MTAFSEDEVLYHNLSLLLEKHPLLMFQVAQLDEGAWDAGLLSASASMGRGVGARPPGGRSQSAAWGAAVSRSREALAGRPGSRKNNSNYLGNIISDAVSQKQALEYLEELEQEEAVLEARERGRPKSASGFSVEDPRLIEVRALRKKAKPYIKKIKIIRRKKLALLHIVQLFVYFEKRGFISRCFPRALLSLKRAVKVKQLQRI